MSSARPNDTGRDDMNLLVAHVICNDCSFLPNKKKYQILFWENYNHCVVHITIHITKFNIILSKQLQHVNSMLQCPFISTLVFKDPDWKLGHIATIKRNIHTSDPELWWRVSSTPRGLRIFLHIHSKYERVLQNVETTIKKHTSWPHSDSLKIDSAISD